MLKPRCFLGYLLFDKKYVVFVKILDSIQLSIPDRVNYKR
jgi:hypothetical protein